MVIQRSLFNALQTLRGTEVIFPCTFFELENGCVAIAKGLRNLGRSSQPMLSGRPQIKFKGELWWAARLSFHLNKEEIPRSPPSLKFGLVCHTCDHEWCINPEHLYLGTQKQNVGDLYARHPTIHAQRSSGSIGRKHTEETRTKIGDGNRGSRRSPEAREKMKFAAVGRTFSKEARINAVLAIKGKPRSLEVRLKIRDGHLGKKKPRRAQ